MTDQFDDDLAAMILDLPTSFTFSGTSYTGVFTILSRRKPLADAGGFLEDFDASLYCREVSFSTAPVCGNSITIGSNIFHVEQVDKSPDGIGITFRLKFSGRYS